MWVLQRRRRECGGLAATASWRWREADARYASQWCIALDSGKLKQLQSCTCPSMHEPPAWQCNLQAAQQWVTWAGTPSTRCAALASDGRRREMSSERVSPRVSCCSRTVRSSPGRARMSRYWMGARRRGPHPPPRPRERTRSRSSRRSSRRLRMRSISVQPLRFHRWDCGTRGIRAVSGWHDASSALQQPQTQQAGNKLRQHVPTALLLDPAQLSCTHLGQVRAAI